MKGWWDIISSSASRVSQTAGLSSSWRHISKNTDFMQYTKVTLKCFHLQNHRWVTRNPFLCFATAWSVVRRAGQTLVGSHYPPPGSPYTHTRTHTAGQSFFTQPNGPLTGLGEGLPLCKADWQDWHLHIATLIMGICLDAPVWGPSRVPGCCHRDGGEPLVVWGADRDPVILLRGGQTWPPWLAPFDLGGKQRAASQERDRSFQVHFADCACRSWETEENGKFWYWWQEYCVTVWMFQGPKCL